MNKWIIKLFNVFKKVSPCIHGSNRLKCNLSQNDNVFGDKEDKLYDMKRHNVESIVKMNELLVGMHMEFKIEDVNAK